MATETVDCTNCGRSNKSSFKYCIACGHELPQKLEPVSVPVLQQQSVSKNKKIFIYIISFAVFVATYTGTYLLFFKQPSFDKVMMQVASELNKTCPLMVDQETRLDNTIALPGNIFQYNYTLINREKSSLDIETLKQNLEPQLINSIKNSPQMQPQREHKTIMNYSYRDKNGETLFILSITPDKYE